MVAREGILISMRKLTSWPQVWFRSKSGRKMDAGIAKTAEQFLPRPEKCAHTITIIGTKSNKDMINT
jgi:hypothetical protein